LPSFSALASVAVSDTVPKFDVVRECRYEGGSTADIDRCSRQQLKNEWARFVGTDKSTCMTKVTTLEFRSYVELQICLEMGSEVRKDEHNSPDPGTGTDSPPPQLARTSVTVGAGHDPMR
jgi:hypothetical protein